MKIFHVISVKKNKLSEQDAGGYVALSRILKKLAGIELHSDFVRRFADESRVGDSFLADGVIVFTIDGFSRKWRH